MHMILLTNVISIHLMQNVKNRKEVIVSIEDWWENPDHEAHGFSPILSELQ